MEERLHRVEATGSQIIDEAEANEARREINGSGKPPFCVRPTGW